jgi:transcriptional regulator with XRE-family HTH domain
VAVLELTLGNHIMLQRRKLGMTQTDLAHKSGVGYATISRLENDRGPQPNRATLIALAYALQIDPEELLAYLRGGE